MTTGEGADRAPQNRYAQYDGRAIDRLNAFGILSGEEKESLGEMALAKRTVARGRSIRQDGADANTLYILLEGWAASAISFSDGSRQLTSVSLPGDLLGLPALSVREPIDALIALNPVTVCDIPARNFAAMFTGMPRLATMLFLVSQEERMLAMERLALMGRAPAEARMAALFLRLQERLSQGAEDALASFAMPLTQVELGDLIGISAVHVNAVLKNLREAGIAAIRDRELHILDFDALVRAAGVQPWRRSDPDWLQSEPTG